jgi:RNA polymerase sigma-70 factor (ECF subfamily)
MIVLSRIIDLQQRIATNGDMQAYKELYTAFFSRLYRFAYSLVKSREAAEEIVSDVFVKVWQIRDELTGINNLQVYLYTVTKNFSLNYIAKYHKAPVVSLDEVDVEAFVARNNPEDILISMDVCDRINEAIRSLPSQCRLIFHLVKEDGLQYKEVAAVLNISVFTVRNQVAIATKKIAGAIPAHLSSSNAVKGIFSAS